MKHSEQIPVTDFSEQKAARVAMHEARDMGLTEEQIETAGAVALGLVVAEKTIENSGLGVSRRSRR